MKAKKISISSFSLETAFQYRNLSKSRQIQLNDTNPTRFHNTGKKKSLKPFFYLPLESAPAPHTAKTPTLGPQDLQVSGGFPAGSPPGEVRKTTWFCSTSWPRCRHTPWAFLSPSQTCWISRRSPWPSPGLNWRWRCSYPGESCVRQVGEYGWKN